MSAWWWSAPLLVVAVVVMPALRLWDRRQARSAARQAQHDALVDAIHASDPEISQLEACWQLDAYQREEHPHG